MTDAATPLSPKRAQTQNRLMEGARRVFAERGIQAASVEEICEAAGFTRGAFYSNFASKTELCVALLRNYVDVAYAAARGAVADVNAEMEATSVDELVRTGVQAFLALQRRDREWLLVAAELRLSAARDEDIRAAYVELNAEATRLLGGLLEPALERLGYTLRLPLHRALMMMQSVYEQGNITALVEGDDLRDDEVRDNLAMTLRALLVPADDEAHSECPLTS